LAKYIGMLNKIFSGYKTDAERAAIDFAALNWIEIVAYVPPGFIPMKNNYKSEVRIVPSYNEIKYIEENIHNSEGTVYFSLGEADAKVDQLKKGAALKSKPFLHINLTDKRDLDALRLLKSFCEEHSINSLHITGSSVGDENCYREVLNILDGLHIWGIQYNQPENIAFEQEDEEIEDFLTSNFTKEIDNIYSRIQKDIEEVSHYHFILNHTYNEARKTVYTDNGIPYVKIYDPDLYDPSYYEHDSKVQSHLLATVILLLFSKFEDGIDNICKAIKERLKIQISWKDLRGENEIDRFRKYIETFGKFNKPENSEWEVIDGLYIIRNFIAHSGGRIYDRRNRLDKIKKLKEINARIRFDNKEEYERRRKDIVEHNNKIKNNSKISIQTINDLKQAINSDTQLREEPRPLIPEEEYFERFYLLEDFPGFAINQVKNFFIKIKKEHEKLYDKFRIVSHD
jgi:hypothetical protein